MRTTARYAVVAAITLACACRKSDMPSLGTGTDNTVIRSPLTINLIPAQNQLAGDRRVYLPIMQVGSKKASLKTVFDTGSEGLVMSGTSIFSPSSLSDTGVVINSKDSAIINGITVTSAKVTYTYGSPPATRSFYGNIAYAPITIGDASGNVQTGRMPFVVVYKGIDNQTKDTVPLDANSDGVAGVQSSGYDPTIALVSNASGIKSPFNYINYANGLFAGFMLAPLSSIGWSTQPSNMGFPPTKLLTLGLTDNLESGFSLQSQRLDIGNLFDPDLLGTVTFGSTALGNSNILLDTGTPVAYYIYDGAEGGSNTLSSGIQVDFLTREGFSYGYTTNNPFFQTTVESNGQPRCIFGIDFFLNNYFLIDYTEHYIGLKGS